MQMGLDGEREASDQEVISQEVISQEVIRRIRL